MESTLRDDVKSLMDKGFGDDRILRQILRACDNDEVISNFERGYVKRLAEQHLNRRPHIHRLQIPTASQKMPNTNTTSQALVRPTPQIVRRKRKTKLYPIIAIIFIAVVAIAVSAYLSLSATPAIPPVPQLPDLPLYITTDLQSYNSGDIISISGRSDEIGTVDLSIENPSGVLVWTETVTIKRTGEFATLAIAAGQEWSELGEYTITANDGSRTSNSIFTYR